MISISQVKFKVTQLFGFKGCVLSHGKSLHNRAILLCETFGGSGHEKKKFLCLNFRVPFSFSPIISSKIRNTQSPGIHPQKVSLFPVARHFELIHHIPWEMFAPLYFQVICCCANNTSF